MTSNNGAFLARIGGVLAVSGAGHSDSKRQNFGGHDRVDEARIGIYERFGIAL